MNDRAAKVLLIVLIILALIAVALSFYKASNPVPMTGYVTKKTYHPEYFPADDRTPWVYCVVIQDTTATRCASWRVPKEVYDRYTIGQYVKKGLW